MIFEYLMAIFSREIRSLAATIHRNKVEIKLNIIDEMGSNSRNVNLRFK